MYLKAKVRKLNFISRVADRQPLFDKGQSKRIWNELYKVLDCSDVVMMVLDARNPLGTRCTHIENYLKKHAKHKHFVFILNKVHVILCSKYLLVLAHNNQIILRCAG